MNNIPFTLTISKIIRESPRVKSFVFNSTVSGKPGQFFMVWVPGVGERPFSFFTTKKGIMLSVADVGTVSSAMHKAKVGDRFRFRGPFGTHFKLPKKREDVIMIAGGYGVVPLACLAEIAKNDGYNPVILNGARTAKEVLYQKMLKKKRIKMLASTDDGSLGKKGFVHELLIDYLANHKKPIKAFICGPEIMEYHVAQVLYKARIPFEVSVERHMKCGIGVCGSCSVDPTGWRMCVEGPVVSSIKLKHITEFGKYHREASGSVIHY